MRKEYLTDRIRQMDHNNKSIIFDSRNQSVRIVKQNNKLIKKKNNPMEYRFKLVVIIRFDEFNNNKITYKFSENAPYIFEICCSL